MPRTALQTRNRIVSENQRGNFNPKNSVLQEEIYCTSFDSRIGRIYVASTEDGVCKISLPKENRKDFYSWLKVHFDLDLVIDNRSRNRDVIDQLTRYFNGRLAKFTCPVDLIGTPFQVRVWKELSKIPYGSTITYKHLAKRVHAPKAFQAVGRANGANPLPIIIPCHRVIGSDGSLVGYAYGVKTKEFFLRLEGAIII
ncbi:MAG: methylated-DNA--[protein]-cysteine S-methyltransferase [Ignavibacteriales bacterium]|nr:methylated-DNA--[protein]-cysteine S-methyltransferase [Ignavibacteriales bacterium]